MLHSIHIHMKSYSWVLLLGQSIAKSCLPAMPQNCGAMPHLGFTFFNLIFAIAIEDEKYKLMRISDI